MARKCGTCQANMIANSSHAPRPTSPLAAAYPITGGIAPGTAPTNSAAPVNRFIGVYRNT